MRITNLSIKRYGSIKEISLPASNLTILIGKNGSGKSFILEALHRFFSEFNSLGGGLSSGQNDYLWFRRDPTNPIEISIDISIDDDEVRKIFPLPEDALKILKEKMGNDFSNVRVTRTIDIATGWHTKLIKWGNIDFVKDDKPLGVDELNNMLNPDKLTRFVCYFFDPNAHQKNIMGHRLIVDVEKKEAYLPTQQIDSLVIQGAIMSNIETRGQDFRIWATQQGITLNNRAPTSAELPVAVVSPDRIQNSLTSFTNILRTKFRLIHASRDVKGQAGIRQAFIDPPTLQSLTSLSVSTAIPEEKKWSKFREIAEELLKRRLEPNPGQFLLHEGNLRLPVSHVGGGEQSLLGLISSMSEDNFIFGVEEPETHLHADLIRTFFAFIREKSKTDQIFLITHASLLVDKSCISNNWLIHKDNGETKVKRLENKDDFKLVLHQLGVLPSDIYLCDQAIFVEGGTEKQAVLPIWARKVGMDIDNVAIISLGGSGNLKNNLRIWLEIARYAPIEYYILLDSDAKSLAFDTLQKLNIEFSRFHILKKGTIEDYYPDLLLKDSLKDLFGIDIPQEEISKSQSKSKLIEQILTSQKKLISGWKIMIGQYVAEKMGESDIPEEVKEILQKLHSK